jgi:hypothetical protein
MSDCRMICPQCRSTYVFSHDPGERVRKCRSCQVPLVFKIDGHLENVQLNPREFAWSERLLLSVYPEGVIS